ncbi:MAG: AI-2E family transporter [Gemmatimonadota bacterium]|nr:AI-2E family transporter [Gemmatimonadota bacterium]
MIGLVALIWLIWLAHPLIFTAFLGLLFGLAISAGADWLQRWRIPRGIGVSIVVVAFFGLMYGIAAWIGPTIRVQAKELRVKLPEAIDKGEIWLDSHRDGLAGLIFTEDSVATDTTAAEPDSSAAVAPAATPVAGPGQHQPGRLRGQMLGKMRGARRYLFPFFRSTLEVFAGLLLVLFIAIYIAAEPDMYRRGLLALVPLRSRARIDAVLTGEAQSLRKWLITQLIAMIAVGVARTIALLLLHVKAAFALGVVAAIFGFVPTIGPLVSGIPAVAMAFLDSPEKALYVALAYWAIQFVDAHLLIPLMMKGNVNLPPALTLFSQALMALLFGILGLVVAVPLLAAVMVAVRMLYVEDVASKDTGQFPAAGAG